MIQIRPTSNDSDSTPPLTSMVQSWLLIEPLTERQADREMLKHAPTYMTCCVLRAAGKTIGIGGRAKWCLGSVLFDQGIQVPIYICIPFGFFLILFHFYLNFLLMVPSLLLLAPAHLLCVSFGGQSGDQTARKTSRMSHI